MILTFLKKFDFLTREQIRKHCRLGTIRNANRVLNELSIYLKCVRDGYHSIYYLSKEGREYVECEKIRKKGGHVQHTIMRNDLWFYLGCPYDWENEIKFTDGKTTIISDAKYVKLNEIHLVEVDHLQPMKENRQKITKYIEIFENGIIKEALGHFPSLIWLTTTELRRKQLQDACQSLPSVKVYTTTDIK